MIDLKLKLCEGENTFGSWVTIGHSSVAEIMCQAGFDWLVVDMEHSAISIKQALDLIRTIELCGVVPLARVAENNPVLIKKVMDAGVHGVIVPSVNSSKEAVSAVAAVRYPPGGSRGVGLSRAHRYGFAFDDYKQWLEKSTVIVQIEHIKAIENLEAILDTEGVDGTMIGPYDLSGSLGFPGDFERREVREAIRYYEECCDRKGKPKGFHIVKPDPGAVESYASKSYAFLALGVDMIFLGQKCREVIGFLKQS